MKRAGYHSLSVSVGQKRKAMTRFLKILALCCCCGGLSAQNNADTFLDNAFNWGLKGGFNGTLVTHYDVAKSGEPLEDKTFTNKTGYGGGLFIRINLGELFMQPEFAYCYSKERYAFVIPGAEENSALSFRINARHHEVSVPVLIGYNMVKSGNYLFNIYVGPDFRNNFRTHFTELYQVFTDVSARYRINGVVGFSLNVAHLLFDFRYMFRFPNTDVDFADVDEAPEYLKRFAVSKNENLLSFSCGLMF